jgi:hypothetical protein
MSCEPSGGVATLGLHRSVDEVWHSYRGYVLVLQDGRRVAVGPGTHEKHAFPDRRSGRGRRGTRARPAQGMGQALQSERPAVDPPRPCPREPAGRHRRRHRARLEDYRATGHRRLDPRTYERSCRTCPFGAVMPTEVIVDHWNPAYTTEWWVETHCYGPRDSLGISQADRGRFQGASRAWCSWTRADA